jgi:hypothetical protein
LLSAPLAYLADHVLLHFERTGEPVKNDSAASRGTSS